MDKERPSQAIQRAFAESEKAALTLNALVKMVFQQSKVVAQEAERLLANGSPNGSTQFDRKELADIVRVEASRVGLPIPKGVKSIKIARAISINLRRAGIPLLRSGRLDDLALGYKPDEEEPVSEE